MEHIVQFGVSIDDSAIQRRVEDSCVEAVKKKMMSCFFDNYSNPKFETEEIIKSLQPIRPGRNYMRKVRGQSVRPSNYRGVA